VRRLGTAYCRGKITYLFKGNVMNPLSTVIDWTINFDSYTWYKDCHNALERCIALSWIKVAGPVKANMSRRLCTSHTASIGAPVISCMTTYSHRSALCLAHTWYLRVFHVPRPNLYRGDPRGATIITCTLLRIICRQSRCHSVAKNRRPDWGTDVVDYQQGTVHY
jgi:hypothetical protein